MEKRVTPSPKGVRLDADMAAALSRGGVDRLREHTYQTAIACRVFTVWTLSRGIGDTNARRLVGLRLDRIAHSDRFKYACMFAMRGISAHLAIGDNFAPCGA